MSGPFGSQQFMYKAGAKGAVDLLEEDADSDTFVCEFTGTGPIGTLPVFVHPTHPCGL